VSEAAAKLRGCLFTSVVPPQPRDGVVWSARRQIHRHPFHAPISRAQRRRFSVDGCVGRSRDCTAGKFTTDNDRLIPLD
jgi:hypothetical protein